VAEHGVLKLLRKRVTEGELKKRREMLSGEREGREETP